MVAAKLLVEEGIQAGQITTKAQAEAAMEEAIKGGVEQGRKRKESALAAAAGALTAQGTGAEGLAEAMVAMGWEATPPGWAP